MNDTREYALWLYATGDGSLHMSGVRIRDIVRTVEGTTFMSTFHEVSLGTPIGGEFESAGATLFTEADLSRLSNWDSTIYGDFSVFDVNQPELITTNLKQTIDQYALATWTPKLSSKVFDRLGSTFFFITHDDGWHSKLYTRDESRLRELLKGIVAVKFGGGSTDFVDDMVSDLLSGIGLWLEHRHRAELDMIKVAHVENPLVNGAYVMDMDAFLNRVEYRWIKSIVFPQQDGLGQELLSLAQTHEPQLVPILSAILRKGGLVKRYKSGAKAGALYLSLSPATGADYGLWTGLARGQNRMAYKRLQELSRLHYQQSTAVD